MNKFIKRFITIFCATILLLASPSTVFAAPTAVLTGYDDTYEIYDYVGGHLHLAPEESVTLYSQVTERFFVKAGEVSSFTVDMDDSADFRLIITQYSSLNGGYIQTYTRDFTDKLDGQIYLYAQSSDRYYVMSVVAKSDLDMNCYWFVHHD